MYNKTLIINALHESGIYNPISIAAIMAIVFKESNFTPQSEIDYSNTSNTRIRQIFSATRSLSEHQLNELKNDPVKFFNVVYGGRYGNNIDEGYKYRGRGFNQLTFKDNYRYYGNLIGIDLVNNPELANIPDIAAKITAVYMLKNFMNNTSIVQSRYGAAHINDFKDKTTAVNAFYNANAGFGNDTSKVQSQPKLSALSVFDNLHAQIIDVIKG